MNAKKELRKEILARRDALSLEERAEKSVRISESVIKLDEFKNAAKLLLFSSIRSEVDTTEIYNAANILSKEIYYPRVMDNRMEFYLVDETTEWQTGKFGIREPKVNELRKLKVDPKDKIFVLMPGAVFDKNGNRIGYGGGYYDKYLQQLEEKLPLKNLYKVAVAYDCQMVENGMIEAEVHDVKPDCIVTETHKYNILCKH